MEIPQAVSSLSARVLDQRGVYLLENGVSGVVHFGPEAPPEMIYALLGGSQACNLAASTFVQFLRDLDPCSAASVDASMQCMHGMYVLRDALSRYFSPPPSLSTLLQYMPT